VEDEQDSREALRLLLENDGHEVSFAQSGSECLARLESFPAEVALVDVGLPGMDGYEVARRVRKLPGGDSILLIALTGYGGDKHETRAFDAGFDRHITKPVSYEQIVRAFG
jgi:two-component system CheB/CheR fusion protein